MINQIIMNRTFCLSLVQLQYLTLHPGMPSINLLLEVMLWVLLRPQMCQFVIKSNTSLQSYLQRSQEVIILVLAYNIWTNWRVKLMISPSISFSKRMPLHKNMIDRAKPNDLIELIIQNLKIFLRTVLQSVIEMECLQASRCSTNSCMDLTLNRPKKVKCNNTKITMLGFRLTRVKNRLFRTLQLVAIAEPEK